MAGKILKFVASRQPQNTFARLASYIKLLNSKNMFLEGALLICWGPEEAGLDEQSLPGTPSPSPIPLDSIVLLYATAICNFILADVQLICK